MNIKNTLSTFDFYVLSQTAYPSLRDGLPIWMCGPVATPGIAARKARNGMPWSCKYLIKPLPSGLSGCKATRGYRLASLQIHLAV